MQDRLKRLIRELIDRPESPMSLAFMVKVQDAMHPIDEGLRTLIGAIAADLEAKTDESRLAMVRAKAAFESLTHGNVVGEEWEDLVAAAQKFNEDRLKRPPPMTDILDIDVQPSDLEYKLAGGLGGIQGTWHRLWSTISTTRYFTGLGVEDTDDAVATLREEFEGKFGRPLNQEEWGRLVKHAYRNCDEVLIPTMARKANKQDSD